jgi:glutamate N-acetyltransferase/amino-acid N-acetyltransferase
MDLKPSPLAPTKVPRLPEIAGARLATGEARIRYQNRTDLLVVELQPGTTIGGALTRSLAPSAPVDWCRACLPRGSARALVVNSGNANAFTGTLGAASVKRTVQATSRLFNCADDEVFLASTGVIGEPLPDDKITALLPSLVPTLRGDAWPEAARAIMTTDTFPKVATRTTTIDGTKVTLNGIAKGSGMIQPDMATMLAFIITDAAIPAAALATMTTSAVDRSFNCATVDSDTSTSDTVLVCATGAANHSPVVAAGDAKLSGFRRALTDLMTDLAKQVVADGEGAEKFVTIDVTGAASRKAARRIGLAIANSPLVKTAIAGEDANWGRIVMAVGKAGEKADRDKLAIKIGGVMVAEHGQRVDGYDETPVAAHIKGRDIKIAVDVGVGGSKATVWTCDLTHGYIDINAGYRS